MISYVSILIRLKHLSSTFSCLDYGDSLDRNRVAKAFALAVDDARNKNVTVYTVVFGCFNHNIVRIKGL